MRIIDSFWLIVAVCAACGADWNQWRGPVRDGNAAGFVLPNPPPKQLTRKWKTEVGEGWSSPLVVGGRVFILSRQNDNEVVRCLDVASGKEFWRESYPAPYVPDAYARFFGKSPRSTPVCVSGRLYTFGISGILSCFDTASGKLHWRREFSREFKNTAPLYGASMSPLVDAGMLIVHVGGHDDGALTAFDAETGAVRWRWTGDGPSYASPIIVKLAGVRQIITQTQELIVSVEATTGRLLWKLPFKPPPDQNCITPIADGETLIFAGTNRPTFACRVHRDGDNWTTEKLWETNDVKLYTCTPVLSGKLLYGMSELNSGQMFSLDVATGKVAWRGAGRFSQFVAHVFNAGPLLLAFAADGSLHLFKKDGAALAEIARYQVADTETWASPAIAGNRILVKDTTTLALWEFPK